MLVAAEEDIIEGDSHSIVQWASGGLCPWYLLDKVEEIREIIDKNKFQVIQIPREDNSRYDELAKEEVELQHVIFLSSLLAVLSSLFLGLLYL